MTSATLEERLTALEKEMVELKKEPAAPSAAKKPWWEEIRGTFKNDPTYAEAMQLGRAWRESQREDDASENP